MAPPPVLPALPCYLNGAFTTIDRAQVSVMDRGFLLGDGIYEVVPFYGGRPFRWPQHLARLRRSLQLVRIDLPLGDDELLQIATSLVAAYADSTGAGGQIGTQTAHMVYFQITRGVALRDHAMVPGPRAHRVCHGQHPAATQPRPARTGCGLRVR